MMRDVTQHPVVATPAGWARLSAHLRARRTDAGLRQLDMITNGLSRGTIQAIERGSGRFRAGTLRVVEDVYGLAPGAVTALLRGDDPPAPPITALQLAERRLGRGSVLPTAEYHGRPADPVVDRIEATSGVRAVIASYEALEPHERTAVLQRLYAIPRDTDSR